MAFGARNVSSLAWNAGAVRFHRSGSKSVSNPLFKPMSDFKELNNDRCSVAPKEAGVRE